jgi:hypothetical protein
MHSPFSHMTTPFATGLQGLQLWPHCCTSVWGFGSQPFPQLYVPARHAGTHLPSALHIPAEYLVDGHDEQKQVALLLPTGVLAGKGSPFFRQEPAGEATQRHSVAAKARSIAARCAAHSSQIEVETHGSKEQESVTMRRHAAAAAAATILLQACSIHQHQMMMQRMAHHSTCMYATRW